MTSPNSRLMWRYLSGRPLDGRRGYPYLCPGNGRWSGLERQAARILIPAAAVAAKIDPIAAERAGVVLGMVAAKYARVWLRKRRFRRAYLDPTLAALRPGVGVHDITLHVDPGLGNLTPRLAKPLSPAEEAVREWYGEHVEPVVRWPGQTVMRGWWLIQRAGRPVTRRARVFRRPGEKPGPRIQLTVDTPYLTDEQRKLVSSIIHAKIPVADLVEHVDMVGPNVNMTWTVRRRPPGAVGLEQLRSAFEGLSDAEFYLGQGAGDQPVSVSLDDDSPHIAVSAGTGAGKSVLAQLVAVQVLRRGGQVVILDRKGSHRWAVGLAGVDYCTRPEQMHEALLRVAATANQRNDLAFHEDEGWDPGPRILVICEELNATIGQLADYWAAIRQKGEPKQSPAIAALKLVLFMGRSAKVHVLAVAQMLTARAIGGPEARENFGIRCLARFTTNAWKMLVPEAAQPRASRTRGRWQVVVGGQATEVQVCFLPRLAARAFAVTGRAKKPDSALACDVPGNGPQTGNTEDPLTEPITIRQAIDEGVLPWGKDATKMRLVRARRAGRAVPEPVGKRGLQTDLYRRGDLVVWAESDDGKETS